MDKQTLTNLINPSNESPPVYIIFGDTDGIGTALSQRLAGNGARHGPDVLRQLRIDRSPKPLRSGSTQSCKPTRHQRRPQGFGNRR